jgi:cell division protein FtsB
VTLPRWLRFVTDRSQLIIILGALVVVVALFGFSELAVEKSAAVASRDRAQAKVDQLRDQNEKLKRALEQAREGQHVAPKAYQYFGQTPPGVTIIIPEEPAIIQPSLPPEPDSAWSDWTAQVGQSLADGIARLSVRIQEMTDSAKRRLNP